MQHAACDFIIVKEVFLAGRGADGIGCCVTHLDSWNELSRTNTFTFFIIINTKV